MAYNEGENPEFFFFWGHQPEKDGSISKSCLSQWWVAPFVHEEIEYRTAEHFMMSEKARLFRDEEIRSQIIDSETPKEAKGLGRKVRNFEASIWNEHKFNIVKKANQLKFSQHESLRSFLGSTQGKTLVEASPFDRIWGIGMTKNNPKSLDPNQWRGQNLLGYALMEVRDELFKEKHQ